LKVSYNIKISLRILLCENDDNGNDVGVNSDDDIYIGSDNGSNVNSIHNDSGDGDRGGSDCVNGSDDVGGIGGGDNNVSRVGGNGGGCDTNSLCI